MKTRSPFLWAAGVLFAIVAVGLLLLWRYIYTPVSIGKMERFYKKHHTELEELADYANYAVDDSAYLWMMLFPNGDEGLHVSPRGVDDTLYHGVDTFERDSLLRLVGMTGEEYYTIVHCLKVIGCISIKVTPDRRQTTIGYTYGGPFDEEFFGYCLYNGPMTDEELQHTLDSPHLLPYNDSVALAMGILNAKAKERYLKKHKMTNTGNH